LGVLRELVPIVNELNRRDPDLARQLRRASTSIALNVAEGSGSRGKNRTVRYHTALGSARETLACLEVAHAQQLLKFPSPLAKEIDQVIAVLYTLTR
jgi:four helix bundle protein